MKNLSKTPPVDGPNQPVFFLSLFLLLLAFFILLNSIVTLEQSKMDELVNHLSSGQRMPHNRQAPMRLEKGEVSTMINPAIILNNASKIWKATLPYNQAKLFDNGDRMVLQTHVRDLFVDGQANVREDRKRLFRNMLEELTKHIPSTWLSVDFTIIVNPQQQEAEHQKRSQDNIMRLQEQLNSASIGMNSGSAQSPSDIAFIEDAMQLAIKQSASLMQVFPKEVQHDLTMVSGIMLSDKREMGMILIDFFIDVQNDEDVQDEQDQPS